MGYQRGSQGGRGSRGLTVNKPIVTDTLDGWIDISEEGFALENAGRDPAHLAKELVQNALDALNGHDHGRVQVRIGFNPQTKLLEFRVRDNGHGIAPEQMKSIRTVFWTSKRDDPTRRGRMGRGFKEPLLMAAFAFVRSGQMLLEFRMTDKGVRYTEVKTLPDLQPGTEVSMDLRWPQAEVARLESYFRSFLAPAGITLTINDVALPHRDPAELVTGKLTTELFVDGIWKKEKRQTQIELVPLLPGEKPMIFEMGIPVCELEWDQPYHANVGQRVPMNPKRDMVLVGYPAQIHRVALPVLLPKMSQEQVLTDWVGAVAKQVPEETQKAIITKGLGENVVRSVPAVGRRDYNADVTSLGKQTVNPRHLPGGLGEIVKQHVPTAKQVVEQRESLQRMQAARAAVPVDADARQAAVNARIAEVGGRERVDLVMEWSRWFVTRLLEHYPDPPVIGVRIALYRQMQSDAENLDDLLNPPIATWSTRDELTLALDHAATWQQPLSPDGLRTLIHEAAHHRNAHHGAKFSEEVEALAGRAAWIMLTMHKAITDRFGALLTE